jgi:hypothetical protein
MSDQGRGCLVRWWRSNSGDRLTTGLRIEGDPSIPLPSVHLTKGPACANMLAVTIELDTHPEGWRDRPDETPATG